MKYRIVEQLNKNDAFPFKIQTKMWPFGWSDECGYKIVGAACPPRRIVRWFDTFDNACAWVQNMIRGRAKPIFRYKEVSVIG